ALVSAHVHHVRNVLALKTLKLREESIAGSGFIEAFRELLAPLAVMWVSPVVCGIRSDDPYSGFALWVGPVQPIDTFLQVRRAIAHRRAISVGDAY
ncbi:hypothetical protein PFISCL1PPCAC_8525, partial [Pristionchus fissidentatus]